MNDRVGQLPAQGPRGAARLHCHVILVTAEPVPPPPDHPLALPDPGLLGRSAARRSRRSCSSRTSAGSRPASWPCSSAGTSTGPRSSTGTRSGPSRTRPGSSSRPWSRPTAPAGSWSGSATMPKAVQEEFGRVLEVLASFVRDILLLRLGGDPSLLLNPDLEAKLREAALGLGRPSGPGRSRGARFRAGPARRRTSTRAFSRPRSFSNFRELRHV